MSELTEREILIASTFSRVDIWKSQLEENGINVSEAIAIREIELSKGKSESEFITWCENNKIVQEDPIPFGYSTQAEYDALAWKRSRQAEYPDMGSQLNKIYDDGLTKWKSEMVDPIKAKWPKDNSGPK